ncbi:MAG TPA: hypothetical protein EYQ78_06845 [Candidatus Poseidoniales archaeon]|nr:hypothetical protein [Candidatus Poseidoniales archaeon]
MIVDEEIRHSLGDRRFELPGGHPAHRRMRELLMSEVEIAEFESFHQENNQVQIRWNHNRLEELGLVTSRPPRGLISKSGSRPLWYLIGLEEQGGGEEGEINHSERLEQYQFRFDVDRLLANRAPLAAALATDGTEALAWYIPFHDTSSEWGIYIRDIGPRIIANRCFPDLLRTNPGEALELAFDFLFAHEFFHHISEIACTMLENSNLSNPLYRPYFDRLVSGDADEALEEALANSFALDFIHGKQNKDGLRGLMDDCPPGYRDYGEYQSKLHFERGLDWLASMFTGKPFSRSNRYTFGHGLFSHPNSVFNRMKVPLHETTDRSPCTPALPICIFNNIIVPEDIKNKANHKRTPPNARKQFWKCIDKLRGSQIERNRRLEKLNRKDWFKFDVTGGWRMVLEQISPGKWVVRYLDEWDKYMRYRAKNSL